MTCEGNAGVWWGNLGSYNFRCVAVTGMGMCITPKEPDDQDVRERVIRNKINSVRRIKNDSSR